MDEWSGIWKLSPRSSAGTRNLRRVCRARLKFGTPLPGVFAQYFTDIMYFLGGVNPAYALNIWFPDVVKLAPSLQFDLASRSLNNPCECSSEPSYESMPHDIRTHILGPVPALSARN